MEEDDRPIVKEIRDSGGWVVEDVIVLPEASYLVVFGSFEPFSPASFLGSAESMGIVNVQN